MSTSRAYRPIRPQDQQRVGDDQRETPSIGRQTDSVPRRPLLGAVATLAAVALLAVGCANSFGRDMGPLAPAVVSWQAVALPSHLGFTYLHSFAIAASNGAVAYTCVTPRDIYGTPVPGVSGGLTQVWVTHNRGVSWSRVTNLPTARTDITGCAIVVDDANPAAALAFATWQPVPLTDSTTATFATADGGLTWRRLADQEGFETNQLVSWGGTTYTLRCCIPVSVPNFGLFASTDRMRTWHRIDSALARTGQVFLEFWVQPETGGLFEVGRDMSHDLDYLWASADGGQHWAELPTPVASLFIAQGPAAGRSWRICGAHNTASDTTYGQIVTPDHLFCSADGGHSWTPRPVLTPTAAEVQAAHAAPATTGALQIRGIFPTAITTDGDVLMADTLAGAETLYRLAATGDRWQSLGGLPRGADFALYAAGSGPGVLWGLLSSEADSGTIVDPEGKTFTAAYPADPSVP